MRMQVFDIAFGDVLSIRDFPGWVKNFVKILDTMRVPSDVLRRFEERAMWSKFPRSAADVNKLVSYAFSDVHYDTRENEMKKVGALMTLMRWMASLQYP